MWGSVHYTEGIKSTWLNTEYDGGISKNVVQHEIKLSLYISEPRHRHSVNPLQNMGLGEPLDFIWELRSGSPIFFRLNSRAFEGAH